MCPPDYFGVEYEINPWMDRRRQVDKDKASRQWDALYKVLSQDIGAGVELATPNLGLPDLVFTANAGLVVGQTAIASRFRHPERAREEPNWRSWFEANGYKMFHLPDNLHFEGQGDVLAFGDVLMGGYGFRSDLEAVRLVGDLLKKKLFALELVDPWFYHLDTCFCPLNGGAALYYPGAFTEAGRRLIEACVPDPIVVDREEAHHFVCNSVVIGRNVVMSCNCPKAREELQTRGYQVHELDFSEFLKAGGGAKCLVLILT
ncbi:MAG: amidinotransferase, partial [Chloroflexi bacterium]|nr:amidinotransferase [Chloroflexota bacterium]